MNNGECLHSRSLVLRSLIVFLVFSLQILRLSVQRANVFYFFIGRLILSLMKLTKKKEATCLYRLLDSSSELAGFILRSGFKFFEHMTTAISLASFLFSSFLWFRFLPNIKFCDFVKPYSLQFYFDICRLLLAILTTSMH